MKQIYVIERVTAINTTSAHNFIATVWFIQTEVPGSYVVKVVTW